MPKALSEAERVHIRKCLLREAGMCLAAGGMKKTTVDELVKRAGIPKGTFYLFYPSKEHLFLEVYRNQVLAVQRELSGRLADVGGDLTAETFADLVLQLLRMLEESFLFRFLSGGDLERMLRKLPESDARAFEESDEDAFAYLLRSVPGLDDRRKKTAHAALRLILLTLPEHWEPDASLLRDARRMLVAGVARLIFEECRMGSGK